MSGHIEQGQADGGGGAGAVVKIQRTVPGRAIPDKSFTRGSVLPPLITAVYVVTGAKAEEGCKVAVKVLLL